MAGAKLGACKLTSGSRVSSHFHHTGEELFYRGTKNVQGDKGWETVTLEDFAELRKAGLSHPLMDEIESTFNTNG